MNTVEPAIIVALIGASGAAVGWFANHWLTSRRDESRRRVEAQLKFVERQIEELYGPLAALIYEGRRQFRDLLQSLGRNYVFADDSPLPPDELKTWLYWAESEFLPRNEQIKSLLKSKPHLIVGSSFPESYVTFFDHCNSWSIHHRRWKEDGTEYSWRSKVNWPADFEQEVLASFQELKAKHATLLGALDVHGFEDTLRRSARRLRGIVQRASATTKRQPRRAD